MNDDDARMEAFFAELADRVGTAPVTAAEAAELLALARDVAHGVERKYAPLATYAAGLVLDRETDPAERADRIRAIRESLAASSGGDRADRSARER